MSETKRLPGAIEDTPAAPSPDGPAAPDRRRALRRLGGYAMSVAPAMVLLTQGAEAKKGGDPNPPCDNPAWDLGLKRAGHSGC